VLVETLPLLSFGIGEYGIKNGVDARQIERFVPVSQGIFP
jgi:hypothetical protein